MRFIGRWIGGNADPSKLRTVIAWPLVSSICTGIIPGPKVSCLRVGLPGSEAVGVSKSNIVMNIVLE